MLWSTSSTTSGNGSASTSIAELGGTRTAASLSIEAEPDNISVSSVVHSPTTGNTDTVVIEK